MLFHTLSVSQQTAPHTIQSLLVHPLTPGFPITEYCAWRTLLSLVSLLFRLWYYSFAYGSSIIVTLATTFSFALLVHYCCLSVLVFFFYVCSSHFGLPFFWWSVFRSVEASYFSVLVELNMIFIFVCFYPLSNWWTNAIHRGHRLMYPWIRL